MRQDGLHRLLLVGALLLISTRAPAARVLRTIGETSPLGWPYSTFEEGTVDASKIHQIDDFPGVAYVRSVFTYIADYPPGDPRDLDKVAREW